MNRWDLCVVVVALLVLPASGHETWLVATPSAGLVGREVTLDLTSGLDFPEPDHAIAPDRVRLARARPAGEATNLGEGKRLEKTLRWSYTPPKAGLAMLAVELHPKMLELADDRVPAYFAEIDASKELRETWAALKGREPWKETYTKHATSWLAVGDASADRSWRDPAGLTFELVPLVNPATLRIGQEAKFKLLREGKPLAGLAVGFMVEGGKERTFARTSDQGEVSFTLAQAGRVLLYSVDLRRAKSGTGWESLFTTVTLPVQARE